MVGDRVWGFHDSPGPVIMTGERSLYYGWKKYSISRSRIVNHSFIIDPRAAVMFCSCWTIRNLNLSLLLSDVNPGCMSSNWVNQVLRDPYNLHVVMKCCSSSISFGHHLQVLFSRGSFGFSLLPSSIMSLWSEVRNFVNITRSLLFKRVRYCSHFMCCLKPLYVSPFTLLSREFFQFLKKIWFRYNPILCLGITYMFSNGSLKGEKHLWWLWISSAYFLIVLKNDITLQWTSKFEVVRLLYNVVVIFMADVVSIVNMSSENFFLHAVSV